MSLTYKIKLDFKTKPIEFAKIAESVGVDGLLLMPPYLGNDNSTRFVRKYLSFCHGAFLNPKMKIFKLFF